MAAAQAARDLAAAERREAFHAIRREIMALDKAPRALRGMLTQLYRVATRAPDGTFRLSDKEFEEYIEAARGHIKEKYFGIFELSVRAVRAGVLPWTLAAQRLRDYFVPTGTAESLADVVMDILPLVGQVKAATEAFAAFEAAAQASRFGDHAVAAQLAEMGMAALAGIVPAAKAANIAKSLAGRIPKLHHVYPMYHGGK